MIPLSVFKDSFRNIIRWRYRSVISILSLGIGIASLMAVIHLYQSEKSFDRHFADADRIYRLVYTDPLNAAKRSYLPGVLYNSIHTKFSQVESMGRMILRPGTVEYDNKAPQIYPLLYCDPELFNIFPVNHVLGDKDIYNQAANSICLSESFARKLFGEEIALGKILQVNKKEYTVKTIFKDIPGNTHFYTDIILPVQSIASDRVLTDFNVSACYYYVKLLEEESCHEFEKDINSFVRSLLGLPDDISPLSLQKLDEIYLGSDDIQQGQVRSGNRQMVSILPWVAFLLIFVSVCNHFIMDAERSFSLMYVNYLRRIFGEKVISVFFRYYFDNMLYTFISIILASALVFLFYDLNLIPDNQSYILYLQSSSHWIILILFIIPVIPALISTFSFRSHTNSNYFRLGSGGFCGEQSNDNLKTFNLRSSIVLIQVFISIVLSIASITGLRQVKYVTKKDYGLDTKNLLVVENHAGESMARESRYNIFKEVAQDNPHIKAYASASNYPFSDLNNYTHVRKEGQIMEEKLSSALIAVDINFFNTMGIKPLQGMVFDDNLASDMSSSMVINKSLSQSLGDNMLSKNLIGFWVEKNKTVVGVVPDVQFGNIRSNTDKVSFVVEADFMSNNEYLFFRFEEDSFDEVFAQLRDEWFKNAPHEAFEAFVLEDVLDSQVSREKLISIVLVLSTAIAYFLSIMGIISVAEWVSRKKSKEIALRRINGALIIDIIRSSYTELYLPLAAAIVLALPAVYLALNEWLSGFVYRVNVSLFNLVLGVLFVSMSMIIIVILNTYLIFCKNPAENISKAL